MVIMGHIVKTLRTHTGFGIGSAQASADQQLVEQVIERYGGVGTLVFDPSTATANQSLKSIMRVFFIAIMFFAGVPFAVYLIFISSLDGAPRSYETSWMRQIQIYGYSMAPFIPCGMLYVIFSPFNRVKWVLTLATVAMVSFYQYKEQI